MIFNSLQAALHADSVDVKLGVSQLSFFPDGWKRFVSERNFSGRSSLFFFFRFISPHYMMLPSAVADVRLCRASLVTVPLSIPFISHVRSVFFCLFTGCSLSSYPLTPLWQREPLGTLTGAKLRFTTRSQTHAPC